MTPTRRHLFGYSLLLAAVLAGCATPQIAESPRPSASASATATPTPAPPASPASSPPTADPALRPPLIVSAAVASRETLPWCGHEVIDRAANGDFYDAGVRECFLAAYGAGEPAEFVSDGPTVEGARYRVFYRSLGEGPVEVYYDSTADHLSARKWTRASCARFEPVAPDPAGVPGILETDCAMPEVVAGSPETEPTPDELVKIGHLVEFAQSDDPDAFAFARFADEVALGLADEILVRRSMDAVAMRGSWTLESDSFRGRVGPFSALDRLAEWDQNDAGFVRELSVTVGPHAHCASGPVPAPAEFAGLRRISVQPVGEIPCPLWWTVDLFLTDDGRIAAVTLDYYEP